MLFWVALLRVAEPVLVELEELLELRVALEELLELFVVVPRRTGF